MTPGNVAEACRRWVWVSPHSERIETDRWLMVRNPDRFPEPLQLRSVDPDADPRANVEEILGAARRTGADRLFFWVQPGTPQEYVDLLEARGAVPGETLAILARSAADAQAAPPAPEVTIEWVTDLKGTRAAEQVDLAVFGGRPGTQATLEADAAEALRDHRAGVAGRVVARMDGAEVGAAGLTIVPIPGGAANCLWGGAVLQTHRRRGVYSTMVQARWERGRELGATLALVKGRVETSAPILRRLGFEQYGIERAFVLGLR